MWEDPEVESGLLRALELGLSRRMACNLVKISSSTFSDRLVAEPDFAATCRAHEAAGCAHHAQRIEASGQAGAAKLTGPLVRAARFFLSTHDRDAWTEKVHHEHSGEVSLGGLAAEAAEAPADEDEQTEGPDPVEIEG